MREETGKNRGLRRLCIACLLHFKPEARNSRGVVHRGGLARNGTRFSARSFTLSTSGFGDPPDALAALSGTIRQHPPDLHVLLQIGFDWTDFHLKRCRKKVYAVPRLSGLGCHDAREIKLGYLHFRILIRAALMIWLNKSPASRPRPTSS